MVKAYVDQFDYRFEAPVEDDSSDADPTASSSQHSNYTMFGFNGNFIWRSLSLYLVNIRLQ